MVLTPDAASGHMQAKFQPGPIFTQVLLADEINRATPKTQSSLLEAMQEGTVTAAGTSMVLPKPFFVPATQNPVEMEGTYQLPEAQIDRFLFKSLVRYPTEAELDAILDLHHRRAGGAAAPDPHRGEHPQAPSRSFGDVPIASHVRRAVARVALATLAGSAGLAAGGPPLPALRAQPARRAGAGARRPRAMRCSITATTCPSTTCGRSCCR